VLGVAAMILPVVYAAPPQSGRMRRQAGL